MNPITAVHIDASKRSAMATASNWVEWRPHFRGREIDLLAPWRGEVGS
jgi:hypothetical protein